MAMKLKKVFFEVISMTGDSTFITSVMFYIVFREIMFQ
jgi:hypothetical protein